MTVPAIQTGVRKPGMRAVVAGAWLAGLAVYQAAIFASSERTAVWINDIAWALAAALAAISCFLVARQLPQPERRGWSLLSIACGVWFLGQLHWNYNQLVLGVELPFPTLAQLFYTLFSVLFVVGLRYLPESRPATPFTLKSAGNVALVCCCLVFSVVVGMLEPLLRSDRPIPDLWIGVLQNAFLAICFLTALYLFWTYRWSAATWTPMLLLVIGIGSYSVANLIYAHAVMTGGYTPNDFVNGGWLVAFGCIAAAATERLWRLHHVQPDAAKRMDADQRRMEAIVPALLILIMVLAAASAASSPTTRVVGFAAALFVLFAILLGAREALVQTESQQLTQELMSANRLLQTTNLELRRSEASFRDLNAQLEQRVVQRTEQLKSAYDELEGFSYAVAHDLKGPLRAINGLTHFLETELEGSLNQREMEYLLRIRNGSLTMAVLIDDLLAYSHIERRGQRAGKIGLDRLVDSIVRQHDAEIQRRGVEIVVHVERVVVHLDIEGLSLALRNLFENALKYTRGTPAARIEVRARPSDGGLTISVVDNGIGFDMQHHDRIFKIFQRLHREDEYPGTGIGLAIVRKAVERIGGRVWAESKPGEGASFHIDLPHTVLK
jgi:signal transduction histidine kinase